MRERDERGDEGGMETRWEREGGVCKRDREREGEGVVVAREVR